MSYKSGDKVVIISQRGITWNQDGEMDIWQGKVMTIDKIGFTIPGRYTRYTMVEDEGKWAWNNLDIDDEATKMLGRGNSMDLRIKITQQPLDIPEHESDELEKEIQDRMSKEYWDDHIREATKMAESEN